MLELLGPPFLACLVLAGIHAYLGLHVLARGVIFVDLALAQVAALGTTAALLAGHPAQGDAAYYYSLAFTAGGAVVLAATRTRRGVVPQEAIIGIVYVVAAAFSVLVLDRVPQGAEQIKQLLVGSILGVTGEDVTRVTALYAVIGLFHALARRPIMAISLGGEPPHARIWDFAFYFTFGLVVVSSVRLAGVLLVFAYLIAPAVVGAWLAPTIGRRLLVGWAAGFLVSALGLLGSYRLDLPTGATIVAAFGALLAVVALARGGVRVVAALRRDRGRAVAGILIAVGVLVAAAGAGLAAFPSADHLWLDGVEAGVPGLRTAFLTPREREALAESRAAIARGTAELARLRTVQADVQWGARELPPEQQERLRQFLAGRDEIVAGDRLVLRTLTRRARERQRWTVGVPLALAGAVVVVLGMRLRGR